MILGNLDTSLMSLKILFLLIIDKLRCWWGRNFITHFLYVANWNNWLLPASIYFNLWTICLFFFVRIIQILFHTKGESVLCHSGVVTLFVYDLLHHVFSIGPPIISVLIMRRWDLCDVRESSLQIHIGGLLFVRLNLRIDSMCVYFCAVTQPICIALSTFVDMSQIRESLCLSTVGYDHHLLCVLLRCHSEWISTSHNKLRV